MLFRMYSTTSHKHRKMSEVRDVIFNFNMEFVFINPRALHRRFTSKTLGELGEYGTSLRWRRKKGLERYGA